MATPCHPRGVAAATRVTRKLISGGAAAAGPAEEHVVPARQALARLAGRRRSARCRRRRRRCGAAAAPPATARPAPPWAVGVVVEGRARRPAEQRARRRRPCRGVGRAARRARGRATSSGRSSEASSASRPARIGSRGARLARPAPPAGRGRRGSGSAAAAGSAWPPRSGCRLLAEHRRGPLGAQVLRHVVVRRDDLAGLVELPHRLRGRLAGRPGGDDPPGAVVAPVGVPGDLLGVDAVLGQPGVDHLGERGALLGGLAAGCAGRAGRASPAPAAPGRRSAAPGRPARRRSGRRRRRTRRSGCGPGCPAGTATAARSPERPAPRDRRPRPASACSTPATPLVDGQRQQAAHLVGEHQGLAVLGEGDEAYRPHRVASVPLRWPTTPSQPRRDVSDTR